MPAAQVRRALLELFLFFCGGIEIGKNKKATARRTTRLFYAWEKRWENKGMRPNHNKTDTGNLM